MEPLIVNMMTAPMIREELVKEAKLVAKAASTFERLLAAEKLDARQAEQCKWQGFSFFARPELRNLTSSNDTMACLAAERNTISGTIRRGVEDLLGNLGIILDTKSRRELRGIYHEVHRYRLYLQDFVSSRLGKDYTGGGDFPSYQSREEADQEIVASILEERRKRQAREAAAAKKRRSPFPSPEPITKPSPSPRDKTKMRQNHRYLIPSCSHEKSHYTDYDRQYQKGVIDKTVTTSRDTDSSIHSLEDLRPEIINLPPSVDTVRLTLDRKSGKIVSLIAAAMATNGPSKKSATPGETINAREKGASDEVATTRSKKPASKDPKKSSEKPVEAKAKPQLIKAAPKTELVKEADQVGDGVMKSEQPGLITTLMMTGVGAGDGVENKTADVPKITKKPINSPTELNGSKYKSNRPDKAVEPQEENEQKSREKFKRLVDKASQTASLLLEANTDACPKKEADSERLQMSVTPVTPATGSCQKQPKQVCDASVQCSPFRIAYSNKMTQKKIRTRDVATQQEGLRIPSPAASLASAVATWASSVAEAWAKKCAMSILNASKNVTNDRRPVEELKDTSEGSSNERKVRRQAQSSTVDQLSSSWSSPSSPSSRQLQEELIDSMIESLRKLQSANSEDDTMNFTGSEISEDEATKGVGETYTLSRRFERTLSTIYEASNEDEEDESTLIVEKTSTEMSESSTIKEMTASYEDFPEYLTLSSLDPQMREILTFTSTESEQSVIITPMSDESSTDERMELARSPSRLMDEFSPDEGDVFDIREAIQRPTKLKVLKSVLDASPEANKNPAMRVLPKSSLFSGLSSFINNEETGSMCSSVFRSEDKIAIHGAASTVAPTVGSTMPTATTVSSFLSIEEQTILSQHMDKWGDEQVLWLLTKLLRGVKLPEPPSCCVRGEKTDSAEKQWLHDLLASDMSTSDRQKFNYVWHQLFHNEDDV